MPRPYCHLVCVGAVGARLPREPCAVSFYLVSSACKPTIKKRKQQQHQNSHHHKKPKRQHHQNSHHHLLAARTSVSCAPMMLCVNLAFLFPPPERTRSHHSTQPPGSQGTLNNPGDPLPTQQASTKPARSSDNRCCSTPTEVRGFNGNVNPIGSSFT